MTWQAALVVSLWAGWAGLHSWLGKRRFLRTLALLMVLDVCAFIALFFWIQAQTHDSSASGAAALGVYVGAAVLLIPAGVGAFSFWKYGTTRSL